MSGYFAVSIPDQQLWQGFYLPDEYLPSGLDVLAKTREALGWMETPNRKTQTIVEFGGLASQEDQRLLGSLCAVLIEFVDKRSIMGIVQIACAISLLIKHSYFIVEGEISPEGTGTKIDVLSASSVDEAKTLIKARFDKRYS